MSKAIEDIAAERQRQIETEGWSIEHDDSHSDGELARAAACYAYDDRKKYKAAAPVDWPWSQAWWKPKTKREDLVRAGALIAAEIDRLDRLEAKQSTES